MQKEAEREGVVVRTVLLSDFGHVPLRLLFPYCTCQLKAMNAWA